MTIALATKGVICPPATLVVPPNTFSPILKFDVELVLDKPGGFLIEDTDPLASPMGFLVEDTSVIVSTPKGFFVEGDANPNKPAGLEVVDTDFVTPPRGFSVEDI
jgi:hypothetical protein